MNTNSSVTETQLDAMRAQISGSLDKAQARKNRLKHINTRCAQS
jgi:hypothetical protein